MNVFEVSLFFILFTIFFIVYKFIYLDTVIYNKLRANHSKSFLKKNREKSIFKRLLYCKYKNEISKFYFYINMICCIVILLCAIFSLVGFIKETHEILLKAFVFIVPFVFFAIITMLFSSMIERINKKSLLSKLMIYAFITLLIVLATYRTVEGFYMILTHGDG